MVLTPLSWLPVQQSFFQFINPKHTRTARLSRSHTKLLRIPVQKSAMHSRTSKTLTALLLTTVLLVVVATNAAPGQVRPIAPSIPWSAYGEHHLILKCAGCGLPNGGLKRTASSSIHSLSNPPPPSITTTTSLTTEVDARGLDGPTTLFSSTTTTAVTSATIDSDYTAHLIRVHKPDPDCAGCII
ncbi:uncharacterized protein FOMMEDRAFT_17624 [Fomitiporia mediterranea MF3/22]|uniref:uncharacterized protein n=1 Tax=Fomitiporia mediterranea (strain MF3/22) TaxID=694068 RepID=UPI00044090D9|nr:uncharacterized protein FOMMEDRAFT_17624 [Fomitiporia mediterranea MF3/22]EJD07159.1 hypothetical protein FOMMEDRAFT_17624 [Fomitiporia mediterranea MF3/22]